MVHRQLENNFLHSKRTKLSVLDANKHLRNKFENISLTTLHVYYTTQLEWKFTIMGKG